MRKVLAIAWKDLVLAFRDPAALVLMLATPFGLTLTMGFAFGGLTGQEGGGGMAAIPVVLVNQDRGQFGAFLVDAFTSEDLAAFVEPTVLEDAESARGEVDADRAAAAVIIPADFSERILPSAGERRSGALGEASQGQGVIEVYANPTRSISAAIVRGIVEEFLGRVTGSVVAVEVSLTQLIGNGLIEPTDAPRVGEEIGGRAAQAIMNSRPITIQYETAAGEASEGPNLLATLAPGMAILFLMFTVTVGARSVLAEREAGTLPRLLTTPTSVAQVLAGKLFGIYLTGLAQISILIVAGALLFDLSWGSPLTVAVLLLALVATATGWGGLLAAYARTPGDASMIGTVASIVFGLLGGAFFPRDALPGWLQAITRLTPTALGTEAFAALAAGGGLESLLAPIAILLLTALALFLVAAVLFRRQFA